jgi:hypothetical protein
MADDGSGGADAHRDDRVRPGYVGRLLVLHHESLEELVADLHSDDLERLELRLAFEAWADAREV